MGNDYHGDERSYIEEIRSRYEGEGLTKSADQVDRLMEALTRDLYSEPAHYALEFVQNAEDSESSELRFSVKPGHLIVQNNGKLFDRDDVDIICDVARSRKRSKIGYKGFGFKSVVAISERVQIHSADWHFEFNRAYHPESKLRWILIPHWVGQTTVPLSREGATFVVHLQGAEGTIARQLHSLTLRSLLFLESLSRISVLDGTRPPECQVSMFRGRKSLSGTSYRVHLGWNRNSEEGRERWVLVETEAGPIPEAALLDYRESRKEEEVPQPKVAVAFQVEEGKLTVVKDSETVYAFLPTREKSGFPFLLQSNFLVTASRESLHRRPWNEFIRDKVPRTLCTAVDVFKDDPYFRTSFYEILPLEDDAADDFYRVVAARFREMAVGMSIVLAEDDSWLGHEDAYLPTKEAIRSLISPEDLKQLLGKKARYVHRAVKGTRAEKFLHSIGVNNIGKRQILSFLENEDWLRRKPPSWFLKLYAYLEEEGLSAKELQSLKVLRILKDQNGGVGNCSEIFLPPREHREQILSLFGQDIRFLHRRLLPGDTAGEETVRAEATSFLKRLEVPVAERRQLIETVIIPFFEGDKWLTATEAKRFSYTSFAKEYLETTGERREARTDLVEKLKKCLRIKAKSGKWLLAGELYFTKDFGIEDHLEWLLGKANRVEFVSSEYMEAFQSDERTKKSWRDFFTALGVADGPKSGYWLDEIQLSEHPQGEVSTRWKEYAAYLVEVSLKRTGGTWRLRTYDARHKLAGSSYVDGLDEVLNTQGEAQLSAFLQLIDRRFSYYNEHSEVTYFYEYYSWNPVRLSSYWLWTLQTTPCIPTTKGLRKPRQVYLPREEIKAVFGDFVPYLAADIKNEKFLKALGIQDKPTVEDACEFLKYCKDHGVEEAAIYGRIYRVLGDSSASAQIACQSLPSDYIFVPDGDNNWQVPAACFWENTSRFFGADRFYLRNYYGPDVYAAMLNLGVKASPSPEDLADYLMYLPRTTTHVTVELKTRIWQIYLELENALKAQGNEEWVKRLSDITELLTEKGNFEEHPFVGDDRTLYQFFKDDLSFLWLFESWKRVEALLGRIGLPLVSQAVDMTISVGDPAEPEVGQMARQNIDDNFRFIQTLLNHRYPDRDFTSEVSFLKAMPIHSVSDIGVEYSLKDGTLAPKRPRVAPAAIFDPKSLCAWLKALEPNSLALAVAAALGEVGDGIRSQLMQLFGVSSEQKKHELWDLLNIPVPEELPAVTTPEKAALLKEPTEPKVPVTEKVFKERVREAIEGTIGPQEKMEVIDERTLLHALESVESSLELLTGADAGRASQEPQVYKAGKLVQEVTKHARILIRTSTEVEASKNLTQQTINGQCLYMTSGMEPPGAEKVKALRRLLQKTVEVMGGNLQMVSICVAPEKTDSFNERGQLFFNAARDDPPARWIVVAARELARNDPRSYQWYGHVKVMTDLLVKAIERIGEIFPDQFSRVSHQNGLAST